MSPESVNSDLPSLKTRVGPVYNEDRAPDVGLPEDCRLLHQDDLRPDLVVHGSPLVINGLDSALQ